MKTYITLEINKKEIKLTLVEALELRAQLNELTGLGVRKEDTTTDYIKMPSYTIGNTGTNISNPWLTTTGTTQYDSTTGLAVTGSIMGYDSNANDTGDKDASTI